MINIIFSALMQLLVLSVLPFIVYLTRYRKAAGFGAYIGLKPSPLRASLLALLISLGLGLPMLLITKYNPSFFEIMTDPKSVTGQIRRMGFGANAIIAILFTALVKTALAEEILFRGFIAKRLIALTNFFWGNLIQAFLFGIMHSLLFLTITMDPWFLLLIFLIPFSGALAKTWLNEKLANGSIMPGWIAHGAGNLISYSVVAFLL
ncbi:MAG: CPBP family intramembrane glutamic endopeptidase [Bacteroidota bacterium]